MEHASFASRWLLPGLLVAATTAVGCSISDFTEGMFSGGQTPGGEGGNGGATSSGTIDPTTTSTTNSGTPTTTSGGGEGGTGGAGTTTTTTTTTTTSGGGTLDCAGDTCPQGDDSACCWNDGGNQGACIDGPADPQTCNTGATGFDGRRTRIECQLPSHCPADTVCCATRVSLGGNNGYYSQVVCTAEDDCEPSDENGSLYMLCDPANANCPNARPNCAASSLLPTGYNICRGN
ncbi:hypothetical protein [Chondromyces apiculatus]|uniref:Uncharacterized protein n=1 Tax=Chondromyces apiculatus DSM 436 TaxID=1192034 RepID=A0A017TDV5_9BACT|nr:hypothetical protein [Chondromyces apiculatus]EYF06990.1 Hypothetical protein CAP_1249 [Chondromyces apiculatus DSM 436]